MSWGTGATIVLAAALAAPGCGRTHPPRNTTSDLIAFSRVDKAWALSRGAGTVIAVVDWQFDGAPAAKAGYVAPTSLLPSERIGDLKPWHGSWMVEIVRRVAPEARVIPIIGRGLRHPGFQDTLPRGIRYAAEHGAAAVTSSMGVLRQSTELTAAIDAAEAAGTVFVNVHPEGVPGGQDTPALCAPGACDPRILRAGVVSVPEHPVKPHPSRSVYAWPYDLDARYKDGWGFSNAPPLVAGVIALMKSANPELGPAEVRRLLAATAYERDGFRVVDAEAAVRGALQVR